MTHLTTTAPLAARQTRLPRIGFPRLQIGATLGFLTRSYAQAMEVACFAPFSKASPNPAPELGQGEEGRDPNW